MQGRENSGDAATHLIGGTWLASGAARCASIDPATGQVVGYFADGGLPEADAAIEAARRAFANPGWSQNPRLRQDVLLAWAARLDDNMEELARLLVRENGRAIGQARREISGAACELRYYAGLARHMPGHVLESEPGVISTMLREPAGVAGIIVPWNAPVGLLIRSAAPAMAAGCAIVIKPAPQTTLVTVRALQLLTADARLPKGVVNMVTESGHAASQRLVSSHEIDVLSFTGSSATGKRIMADAAPTMKKLSLELGGKSCCLVFDDADVVSVAPKLAAAATILSGQQCTAARRVLVHRSRFDEMAGALTRALSGLVVGPGLEESTDIGPLVDAPSLARVSGLIEQACDQADKVLLRGGRPQGKLGQGFFHTPSLVSHSDPDAFFCQEEIFGPFVVLEAFDTEAQAVALANRTVFGLSASVWTRDGARAMRVARALRDGTVWINDHNKLLAEAETGGYRQSGLGRLHGYDALADFTELKHIYQNVGVCSDE